MRCKHQIDYKAIAGNLKARVFDALRFPIAHKTHSLNVRISTVAVVHQPEAVAIFMAF